VRPVPFAVVHAISFYVWSLWGSGDWRHKSRPRSRHQLEAIHARSGFDQLFWKRFEQPSQTWRYRHVV